MLGTSVSSINVIYFFPEEVALDPITISGGHWLPSVGEKVRFSTFSPPWQSLPRLHYGKFMERWFVVKERFFTAVVPGNPVEAMHAGTQPVQQVLIQLELVPETNNVSLPKTVEIGEK